MILVGNESRMHNVGGGGGGLGLHRDEESRRMRNGLEVFAATESEQFGES